MSLRRNSRRSAPPDLPYEASARELMFPKAKYRNQPEEQIDTRDLAHRKIHPDRDEEYRRWLRDKLCSVFGKTDTWTDQLHRCWSPDRIGNQWASDPCHSGKAFSGKLKRDDSGCIPLCRHAHRLQEDNMDSFDKRFGIDRHEIAARLFAEFTDEMERKGLR